LANPIEIVLDINIYADVVGAQAVFPEIAEVPPRSGNDSADALSVIFDSERYQLFLSPHIVRNLQEIFTEKGVSPDLIERYLNFIIELVLETDGAVVEPPRVVFDLKDHEDNFILDLVKAVDAKILVTRDNELLAESPWNGRLILHPADFVKRHIKSSNDW
jgi:predicted nucleic acid-binding protein